MKHLVETIKAAVWRVTLAATILVLASRRRRCPAAESAVRAGCAGCRRRRLQEGRLARLRCLQEPGRLRQLCRHRRSQPPQRLDHHHDRSDHDHRSDHNHDRTTTTLRSAPCRPTWTTARRVAGKTSVCSRTRATASALSPPVGVTLPTGPVRPSGEPAGPLLGSGDDPFGFDPGSLQTLASSLGQFLYPRVGL